jgi:hypothetical protein
MRIESAAQAKGSCGAGRNFPLPGRHAAKIKT